MTSGRRWKQPPWCYIFSWKRQMLRMQYLALTLKLYWLSSKIYPWFWWIGWAVTLSWISRRYLSINYEFSSDGMIFRVIENVFRKIYLYVCTLWCLTSPSLSIFGNFWPKMLMWKCNKLPMTPYLHFIANISSYVQTLILSFISLPYDVHFWRSPQTTNYYDPHLLGTEEYFHM